MALDDDARNASPAGQRRVGFLAAVAVEAVLEVERLGARVVAENPQVRGFAADGAVKV
jgi:hypothetical protein